MPTNPISWNKELKLILSDADETIADLYVPADPKMIKELTALLEEKRAIFFVTGQGFRSVQWRIIDHIPMSLRGRILVGHCSGAEVIGHNMDGTLRSEPFYSVYESSLTELQKLRWRNVVQQIISEFNLKSTPAMPISDFVKQSQGDPLTVMLEDRGPQITLEVVNGYDLSAEQSASLEVDVPLTHGSYDLRIPIIERADQLFIKENLPITAKLGGVFAVDFVVKGVSKTTAVRHVLEDSKILSSLGLKLEDVQQARYVEIWGDKFSLLRGGTDRHMSEALPQEVRSIDFREENPEEFMPGNNIVVWSGSQHLHHGLLEYLQSRH